MTKNGEILKSIHETLMEARLPALNLPNMEVEIKFNETSALALAKEIFARLVPFIGDPNEPEFDFTELDRA